MRGRIRNFHYYPWLSVLPSPSVSFAPPPLPPGVLHPGPENDPQDFVVVVGVLPGQLFKSVVVTVMTPFPHVTEHALSVVRQFGVQGAHEPVVIIGVEQRTSAICLASPVQLFTSRASCHPCPPHGGVPTHPPTVSCLHVGVHPQAAVVQETLFVVVVATPVEEQVVVVTVLVPVVPHAPAQAPSVVLGVQLVVGVVGVVGVGGSGGGGGGGGGGHGLYGQLLVEAGAGAGHIALPTVRSRLS